MNGNDHQVGRFSCQEIFSKGPTDGMVFMSCYKLVPETLPLGQVTTHHPPPSPQWELGPIDFFCPKPSNPKLPIYFARMIMFFSSFLFFALIVLFWVVWFSAGGTIGPRWWRQMRTCFTLWRFLGRPWLLPMRHRRWSTWRTRTARSCASVMMQGSGWNSTCPTTPHRRSGGTTLEISGPSFIRGRWSMIPGVF